MPVLLRYMRYFLRDLVNVNYSNGKLGDISLDKWDFNNEDPFGIFTSQMRQEETAFRKKRDGDRRKDLQRKLKNEIEGRLRDLICEWKDLWIRPDRNQLRYGFKPGQAEH